MYLIEYDQDRYINAEKIESLNIVNGLINFYTEHTEAIYSVAQSQTKHFLQKINTFDDNHVLQSSEHYPK